MMLGSVDAMFIARMACGAGRLIGRTDWRDQDREGQHVRIFHDTLHIKLLM